MLLWLVNNVFFFCALKYYLNTVADIRVYGWLWLVAFVNSMQIPRIGEFGRRHSGWTTVRSSSSKPGVYWAGRTVRR